MKKMIQDALLSLLLGFLALLCSEELFQLTGKLFVRDSGDIIGTLLSASGKELLVLTVILGFIGMRILRRQKEIKQLLIEIKQKQDVEESKNL